MCNLKWIKFAQWVGAYYIAIPEEETVPYRETSSSYRFECVCVCVVCVDFGGHCFSMHKTSALF